MASSGVAEVMGAKDERSRRRLESTIRQSFDQGDCFGRFVHHSEPAKIGPHDADELVADFFGVDDRPVSVGQQRVQFREESPAPVVDVVAGEQRDMPVRDSDFFVGLQVVRCAADADDAMKIVFPQPDDFFLASYFAVAGSDTARPLADGELVLDDPDEVARLDTECPLAAQFLRHRVTMLHHLRFVES